MELPGKRVKLNYHIFGWFSTLNLGLKQSHANIIIIFNPLNRPSEELKYISYMMLVMIKMEMIIMNNTNNLKSNNIVNKEERLGLIKDEDQDDLRWSKHEMNKTLLWWIRLLLPVTDNCFKISGEHGKMKIIVVLLLNLDELTLGKLITAYSHYNHPYPILLINQLINIFNFSSY